MVELAQLARHALLTTHTLATLPWSVLNLLLRCWQRSITAAALDRQRAAIDSCLLSADMDETIFRFVLEGSPAEFLDLASLWNLCLCSFQARQSVLSVAASILHEQEGSSAILARKSDPIALQAAYERLAAAWTPQSSTAVAVSGGVATRIIATQVDSLAAVAASPMLCRGKHRIAFTVEKTQGDNGAVNVGLIDATEPFSETGGGTAWVINLCTGHIWRFPDPHSQFGSLVRRFAEYPRDGLPNGSQAELWLDMDEGYFVVSVPGMPVLVIAPTHGSLKSERLLPSAVRPFARIFKEGDRVSFTHNHVRKFPDKIEAAVGKVIGNVELHVATPGPSLVASIRATRGT